MRIEKGRIIMKGLFEKNGIDFFTIGGQVHNSSTCTAASMKKAWDAAKKAGLNTIAVPVYWSLLEPEEGKYDYQQIKMLLQGAEEYGIHLIVLWFGSWKNGVSQYVPAWMKKNKERFCRVKTAQHFSTSVLSPHCKANESADCRAFRKMMAYLAKNDPYGYVLGVQVENEPGQLGTPRDYSEPGEAAYRRQVPAQITEWLKHADASFVTETWRNCGSRSHGDWSTVFGEEGAELCTAYAFASYINEVARQGKEEYNLPVYVNVWLGEMYNRVPGIDYPSGGAVSKLLDFWKYLTPDIDAICPDIYFNDYKMYMEVCGKYSRQDNPLYIPESGKTPLHAVNVFHAIVHEGLCGIHFFGVEDLLDESGELKPSVREYANALKILSSIRPLLEKYQGTGKIYSVAQYEGSAFDFIDFGDFTGRIVCSNPLGDEYADGSRQYMDAAHGMDEHNQVRGKGLIIYEGNGCFYLAGEGFRLNLLRKGSIEERTTGVRISNFQNLRHQEYLQLEEGHFENGKYVVDKIRTGDECDHGIWVHSDIGVVHAVLDME